jgi:gamma-glutamylcyclotransferase
VINVRPKPSTPSKLVFAYGSNMNRRQMAARCPGARPVSVATLPDHRLQFVGSSARWGGGVATVRPRRRSKVDGILWRLTDDDLRRLDHFEGYPVVYDREPVLVVDEDGKDRWCSTYVHVRGGAPPAQPSALYLRVILEGYEWAGVPVPPQLRKLYGEVRVAPWS